MKREEIIKLANDAELCQTIWIDDICIEIDSLVAFAKLVAAKEREACARVCEVMVRNGAWITKEEVAAAIRERGEA